MKTTLKVIWKIFLVTGSMLYVIMAFQLFMGWREPDLMETSLLSFAMAGFLLMHEAQRDGRS